MGLQNVAEAVGLKQLDCVTVQYHGTPCHAAYKLCCLLLILGIPDVLHIPNKPLF